MKQLKLLFYLLFCLSQLQWAIAQNSGQLMFDNSYVHEIRMTFEENDFWESLVTNYEEYSSDVSTNQIPYELAQVQIDGQVLDSVGVRLKGFTSFWAKTNKKPFKLDFNEFVPGQKYDGLRKLNLNNGTGDPAMQRDNICYELHRNMGVPASRSSYARVYLNETFWGLYQVIEQVDKEFIEDNFSNAEGNLFKNKGWHKFEDEGDFPSIYQKTFELKTNTEEKDWSGFINFIDVLNNTSDQSFKNEIENIFNVDRFLRVLAIDVATMNWDSYLEHGRNWYMYEDTNTGIFHWIPWDYNFALEGNLQVPDEDCSLWPNMASLLLGTTMVQFYDTSFGVEEGAQFLWDFGDGNTSDQMNPVHTYEEHGQYEVCLTITNAMDCVEKNCTSISTSTNMESCTSVTSGQFNREVDKTFAIVLSFDESCCEEWSESCEDIFGWFSEEESDRFKIDQSENPGVLINRLMSVDEYRKIYYSHFCDLLENHYTPEKMSSFISHNYDLIKDDIAMDNNYLFDYGLFESDSGNEGLLQTITDRIEQLKVEMAELHNCSLVRNSIAYQEVVINELVASNDSTSGIFDAAGEFNDWIELYNNTDADIDLSDAYLSDSKTDLKKWKFPVGTQIEAKGYLIVWADDDEDQPGVHSNFKLNKQGDELKLSNEDGSIVDSLTFEEQVTNVAWARVPNGTGGFESRYSTFNRSNNEGPNSIEEELSLEVNIYPNPTAGKLNILVDEGSINEAIITIYDLSGKRFLHSSYNNFSEVKLDINNLSSGMYILQIRTSEGASVEKKIVKI